MYLPAFGEDVRSQEQEHGWRDKSVFKPGLGFICERKLTPRTAQTQGEREAKSKCSHCAAGYSSPQGL